MLFKEQELRKQIDREYEIDMLKRIILDYEIDSLKFERNKEDY